MRTNGAEWNSFYTDEELWGGYQYHDDTLLSVDNVETDDVDDLPIAAKVDIICGVYFSSYEDKDGQDLIKLFLAWRKKQKTSTFIVECDKSRYEDVKDAILKAGGRIS